jgi:hypothetical protein
MSSPTQRSLDFLRKTGWTVCVVEKWIPQTMQRKDAFGFGDLLGCKVGVPGATLFQVTSTSNLSARREKIKGIPEAGIWLAAGNRIVLHGWAKRGPKGKRKVWTLKEEIFCEDKIFEELMETFR